MSRKYYPVALIGTRLQVTVPVSFETNEQGAILLPAFGYRIKPVAVETVVQKALGASDTGTVVLKNGSTTVATVTLAASAAIGEEDAAPSVAESKYDADDQLSITTAKSTAGGKALVTITYEILPHSNS